MLPGLGRQYYVLIAHRGTVNNEMLAGEMSKTQRSSTFGGPPHSLLGVLATNLEKALAPPRRLSQQQARACKDHGQHSIKK